MGIRTLYFSSGSGSFTFPVDFDSSQPVLITCIGGGGGGSRRAANSGGAGGGGGGSMCRGSFSGLQPGSTIWYSVGSAGTGATATNTNGTAGGNVWVNVSSNATPTTDSQGVLAVGGSGASGATGGAGGAAASGLGNITRQSGGNGGNGGTTTGSGGGGGGAAAKWDGGTGYATGNNGGNGFNGADGGGGGGGGYNGAGANATNINGASGGLSSANAAAAGGSSGGGGGSSGGDVGGGGGGGAGINAGASGGPGGDGSRVVNPTPTSPPGGGGGGGGGSNNSGSTGGRGAGGGIFGGGGGGGGAGVANSGDGGNGGPAAAIIQYTAKTTMLPSTGSISMQDIQTYYGGTSPISLNEYYGGSTLVISQSQNSSNVTIPSSGAISIGNFVGSPFKLYREVVAGSGSISIKNPTINGAGFGTGVGPYGSINDTSFTLSGGSGVAITGIYWAQNTSNSIYNFNFVVSSSTAVTNSGWTHLILNNNTVYDRSSATFTGNATFGSWSWSTANTNPFFSGASGNTTQWHGITNMVYFV